MNSMKVKFVVLLLLVGVLSACASPAANTPASQPTAASSSPTEAPVTAPAAATEAPTEAATEAPAGATVSFASAVLPLLQNRCVNCHGGERTSKGLSLKTYDTLMTGSENGPVVTAGDAANSPLAKLVASGKMPKRGPKLTPAEVQLIQDWINQGAQNN